MAARKARSTTGGQRIEWCRAAWAPERPPPGGHDAAGGDERGRDCHRDKAVAQLPRRALEGSELDPWEALISE